MAKAVSTPSSNTSSSNAQLLWKGRGSIINIHSREATLFFFFFFLRESKRTSDWQTSIRYWNSPSSSSSPLSPLLASFQSPLLLYVLRIVNKEEAKLNSSRYAIISRECVYDFCFSSSGRNEIGEPRAAQGKKNSIKKKSFHNFSLTVVCSRTRVRVSRSDELLLMMKKSALVVGCWNWRRRDLIVSLSLGRVVE